MASYDLGDWQLEDAPPTSPLDAYRYQPPLNAQTLAQQGGYGTLSAAPSASWSDRLGAGFANLMDRARGAPSRQGWQNANEISQNVAGLIPGLNMGLSGNQAYRDYGQGNYAGALANAAMAMPIPGARALAPIKDVLQEGAEPIGRAIATEAGTPGILAYHGSRHDFPSFDFSKIGSGEGAQAYGHGLYFAEHPDVAERYKTAGLGGGYVTPLINDAGDQIHFDMGEPDHVADAHAALSETGDYDAARESIHDDINNFKNIGDPEADKIVNSLLDSIAQLDKWEDDGYYLRESEGHKYQVSIGHDPDKFLDWDKPFSEQHPDVQKAFRDMGIEPEEGEKLTGEDMYGSLSEIHEGVQKRNDFGHGEPSDPWVEAAQSMQDRGIQGIKYLDEGSRFGPDFQTPPAAILMKDLPANVQKNLQSHPFYTYSDKANPSLNAIHDDMSSRFEQIGKNSIDAHNLASNAMTDAGVELSPRQKTYNYVVNNDKYIDVLKKYGIPAAAGGMGLLPFLQKHGDKADQYQMTEQPGA